MASKDGWLDVRDVEPLHAACKEEKILTDEDIFLEIGSYAELVKFLSISPSKLNFLLCGFDSYTTFAIPKKSGGAREISAPRRELKSAQRKLAEVLLEIYGSKKAAHGFVKGRNIVSNAAAHVSPKIVINLDLEDFFGTITTGRIQGLFMSEPFNFDFEIARLLTQLTTFRGSLPQGSPCSPILSNFICRSLDSSLTRFARKNHLMYTRYADDLSFSSRRGHISDGIIDEICAVIMREGFSINMTKRRVLSKSTRQEITGLTVNKYVNVSRRYQKGVRAALFQWEKDGLYSAACQAIKRGKCSRLELIENVEDPEYKSAIEEWFRASMQGRINFIKSVAGDVRPSFVSLASRFNSLNHDGYQFEIPTSRLLTNSQIKSIMKLEASCDNSGLQATGFLIDGFKLVTSHHTFEKPSKFEELARCEGCKSKELEECNAHEEYNVYYFNPATRESDFACQVRKDGMKQRNEGDDWAVFDVSEHLEGTDIEVLPVGDSDEVKNGDSLVMVSYRDIPVGLQPHEEPCVVIGKRNYMESTIWEVDKRVAHGSSGGIVLSNDREIVGVIRVGKKKEHETSEAPSIYGFTPVNLLVGYIVEPSQ